MVYDEITTILAIGRPDDVLRHGLRDVNIVVTEKYTVEQRELDLVRSLGGKTSSRIVHVMLDMTKPIEDNIAKLTACYLRVLDEPNTHIHAVKIILPLSHEWLTIVLFYTAAAIDYIGGIYPPSIEVLVYNIESKGKKKEVYTILPPPRLLDPLNTLAVDSRLVRLIIEKPRTLRELADAVNEPSDHVVYKVKRLLDLGLAEIECRPQGPVYTATILAKILYPSKDLCPWPEANRE
ncbi:hypothetical protein [Pyrodictium delaneyi]|nr:hypothetical protein [Pyrodictium delaneyi]